LDADGGKAEAGPEASLWDVMMVLIAGGSGSGQSRKPDLVNSKLDLAEIGVDRIEGAVALGVL
jgi:hypothetical protein